MTCPVARSFQRDTQMEPVDCCECGSTLPETFFALTKPWAAPMPDLHPIDGRVRSTEGRPDAIADEGAACGLSGGINRCDRSQAREYSRLTSCNQRNAVIGQRTRKRLDTIAFAAAVAAIACFLFWFFTTTPM